jgi:hypothetical protein
MVASITRIQSPLNFLQKNKALSDFNAVNVNKNFAFFFSLECGYGGYTAKTRQSEIIKAVKYYNHLIVWITGFQTKNENCW